MLAAESACLPFQCILEQTLQVSDSFALLPDRQPGKITSQLSPEMYIAALEFSRRIFIQAVVLHSLPHRS